MNGGDVEAFLSLVERHRRSMYNLALRITGNEQDAKDVVQDGLLNAYRNLDQFERRADLRTWLTRIVVNSALDHLRSRRRRPDLHSPQQLSDVLDTAASSSPSPERLAASADWRRRVSEVMDTMSPLERVTFTLRHFEECSIEEIARSVGIGQSAAKQHIFRAVRKIPPGARTSMEGPAVSHLNEDDLVLLYYGEDAARLAGARPHLESCAPCARAYESLSHTLSAVTPPEFAEAVDDLAGLRALLHERSRSREAGAIALVWLTALFYPFSFQALHGSARVAEDYAAGTLLVALTLAWACAGPLVAVLALNRLAANGLQRASSRLLVLGALMAAISPAAYLLVSRADVTLSLNFGVWSWWAALALSSAIAALRWPRGSYSTARFQSVHRLTSIVLTLFVLGHVVNQALAFISVPAYDAMRSVMRVASRDPVMYTVIVAAVTIQMATGAAMGLRRVRAGAVARNLQAVTGWYLAAFLLTHVFSGYMFSPPPQVTAAVAPAANQFNLLATVRAAAQLPFLLLGVAAFLFHVGMYARLAALTYLAEASVRRLSYAAMFVGTTVVVTVGLALCGIHLIR